MRISFLRLARRELYRAAEWYEQSKPGMGEHFYAEVDAALALMLQMPNAHPPIDDRSRRILLRRFPYALIYQDGDTLLILACAHTKRRPGYWKRRLK